MSGTAALVQTPQMPIAREELLDRLDALLQNLPGIAEIVSRARTLLVKPNLGGGAPASMTSVEVIEAFCKWLTGCTHGRIIVGDSSMVGTRAEQVIQELGLRERLKPLGVEVVDLASFPTAGVDLPKGVLLKRAKVWQPVLEADCIVSLAKLKTNYSTRVSLTIKNMKGILADDDKIKFHRLGVNECLVDLLTGFRPHLAIIDAIEGWDINHPVPVGALVGGEDPVAVDWLGACLTGTDPYQVGYLRMAVARGLGAEPPQDKQALARRLERHFAGPLNNVLGLKAPPHITVIDGGACSGCISILQRVLTRMAEQRLLDRLPPLTLALGPRARVSGNEQGTLVAMGNCCGLKREASVRIIGCPPQSKVEVQRVLEELIADRDIPGMNRTRVMDFADDGK